MKAPAFITHRWPTRRRWRGPHLVLVLSAITMIAIAATLALASSLGLHGPTVPDFAARLAPPGGTHPLGTDELGRDLLSRLVYGARLSLLASVLIIGSAGIFGTLVGMIAGTSGRTLDAALMRITDIFLAIPALILAMAIGAALGSSLQNVILAVSAVWWPGYARLARAQVLTIISEAYVEAARSLGSGYWRVLVRHIFPNAMGVMWVKATTDVAYVLLTVSSLGFVGLGPQPPTPELGNMVAAGRGYALEAWWYPGFPGMAIFLLALLFALLGDSIQDVVDPATRRA